MGYNPHAEVLLEPFMLMVLPTLVFTLALDAGDVIFFIIIVFALFGSIIGSIFKALKESAAKRKAQTEAQFDMPRIDEAESSSASAPSAAPRTAGERLQQLAEQRRKQLEQIATRRRQQLEDAVRRREGGGQLESLSSLEPLEASPAPPAPGAPVGSAYDREMEQRRRARDEAQRRREQERARQRQAQQQREQARQRQVQEARRQARPVAAPPPLIVAPAPLPPQPAARPAAPRQPAVRRDAMEEPAAMANIAQLSTVDAFASRHTELGAAPAKKVRRAGIPRLDHPERLRQAFIIKEILDRPLALREGDAGSW